MKRRGFTLIELLVVVIIMGVLTAIAMPQYRRAIDRSKAAEAMQLLPAIFEARERWMIEHLCEWTDSGNFTCADGSTASDLTWKKLDIEMKVSGGVSTTNRQKTDNFSYRLIDGNPTGKNQPCVSAVPAWAASRGLTGAKIYYRGDKFSCTEGTPSGGICDLLNVADSSHRTGCI